MNRVETSLENASEARRRTRTYSARNRLRRDMVKGHPVFELFVTRSSTGVATSFCCTICPPLHLALQRGARRVQFPRGLVTIMYSGGFQYPLDDSSDLSFGVAACRRQLCVVTTTLGLFSRHIGSR